MNFSEITDDGDEVQVLFLHLLMVAATLFCLPCSNKYLHRFEDFVCSSHMPVNEMLIMDL